MKGTLKIITYVLDVFGLNERYVKNRLNYSMGLLSLRFIID